MKNYQTLREYRDAQGFGRDIEVGANVTSEGRSGAGQPAVAGVVVSVDRDRVCVQDVYSGRKRCRSISNLRRVD